jgi:hypothetical protein
MVEPGWLVTGQGPSGLPADSRGGLHEGRSVPVYRPEDVGAPKRTPVGIYQAPFACSAQSFAVVMGNGSGEPEIHRGDIVVIDPEDAPEPGAMAAIWASGDAIIGRLVAVQTDKARGWSIEPAAGWLPEAVTAKSLIGIACQRATLIFRK